MATRQLNLRLSDSDRDLLEAVGFVSRAQSAALARDILHEYLQAHRADPGVGLALEALASADAARPIGEVRRLHSEGGG